MKLCRDLGAETSSVAGWPRVRKKSTGLLDTGGLERRHVGGHLGDAQTSEILKSHINAHRKASFHGRDAEE